MPGPVRRIHVFRNSPVVDLSRMTHADTFWLASPVDTDTAASQTEVPPKRLHPEHGSGREGPVIFRLSTRGDSSFLAVGAGPGYDLFHLPARACHRFEPYLPIQI